MKIICGADQIPQIKELAKKLFLGIHKYSGEPMIRGNRLLNIFAIAMGYRSYSDLTMRSKGHKPKSEKFDFTGDQLQEICRKISGHLGYITPFEIWGIYAVSREVPKLINLTDQEFRREVCLALDPILSDL